MEKDLQSVLNDLYFLKIEISKLQKELTSNKLMKEWVSFKEACELLNYSKYKVNQLIENGYLVCSKKGNKGSSVAISIKSIYEFIGNK